MVRVKHPPNRFYFQVLMKLLLLFLTCIFFQLATWLLFRWTHALFIKEKIVLLSLVLYQILSCSIHHFFLGYSSSSAFWYIYITGEKRACLVFYSALLFPYKKFLVTFFFLKSWRKSVDDQYFFLHAGKIQSTFLFK